MEWKAGRQMGANKLMKSLSSMTLFFDLDSSGFDASALDTRVDGLCVPCQVPLMQAIASKNKVTPTRVLEDMAQLTARQLEKVIEQAAVLRLQKRRLVLPPRESFLLRMINQGLPPPRRERYERLLEKRRDEALTQTEHEELLRLTDEQELLHAQRLKALAALAILRETTLPKLMKQMGLTPSIDG